MTPANALPPYSYVPGHDLPHPVNEPRGHSYRAVLDQPRGALNTPTPFARLPADPASRRQTMAATLGLAPDSLAAVVAELDAHKPECWHTSRAAVARVVAGELRLAGTDDVKNCRSPC